MVEFDGLEGGRKWPRGNVLATFWRTLAAAMGMWAMGALPGVAAPPTPVIWSHLVEHEGYKTRPYRDGSGWSVGIGHNLTANRERILRERPYTHDEIVNLFRRDLVWALDAVRTGIEGYDALPEDIQLVALGVAWTVGRTGFLRMTSFRGALSRRNYVEAGRALVRARWSGQVGSNRVRRYLDALNGAHYRIGLERALGQ